MSTLAIILIVLGAVLIVFVIGGIVVARRRVGRADLPARIAAADSALEQARAQDKGWDRALLEQACQAALRAERPDHQYDSIDLVLADDRPGATADPPHLAARAPHAGPARPVRPPP